MSYHYRADEFAAIELKGDDTDPAEIVTKAVDDVHKAIDERLKAIETKAVTRDTKADARLDKIEARLNRPGTGDEAKPEATIERKAFDRYLRADRAGMTADELKALTVANDAQGGYLAPEAVGSELIKLLTQYSPIRSYARIAAIGAQSIHYNRKVSGTSAYWVSEIGNRTASQPAYEQITLTPYELATFTDISNQLLEDSAYNLEGELTADFAESFGKAEGVAFLTGDGASKPVGLLNATGIAEFGTGAASGFKATNPADTIIGMFHALPGVHAQNAVWIMNRNTLAMMRMWKNGQGSYLLADPITAGMPTTLLGRPVVEMVDMADVAANAHPIIFGDLQGYRIVDRVGLATLRDPYALATNGQTRFHVRKRVGADVTHPDRFIKLKVAA